MNKNVNVKKVINYQIMNLKKQRKNMNLYIENVIH